MEARARAPVFFPRQGDDWQLDPTEMGKAIRFGGDKS
jgi:hypothetical protein